MFVLILIQVAGTILTVIWSTVLMGRPSTLIYNRFLFYFFLL
jgi:hypothetical protein